MIDPLDISIDVSPWDEGFLIIKAYWKENIEVARIHGQLSENGALELDNIEVQSEYPLPQTRLLRLLRKPERTMNFRGQGIGPRILEVFISEAKKEKAATIWGSVVESDLQQNRNLLAWYQRHGFQVVEPDGRCLSHAVKMVVLSL